MAAPKIHPSAIIHEDAVIADDVVIEAYARIGAKVTIGEGCHIQHGAVITGITTLGADNVLYPYACLGTDPQDLKYAGEETRLEVGDSNRFREHSTINKGTAQGGGLTKIGNHNLFMATAHVGHDCIIGNHCVFAFGSGLAGHIDVHDHAILGGMAGVHQFTRIGAHSFSSGGSKYGQDLPPFMICQGIPSKLKAVNLEGLKRRGFTEEARDNIRMAYRVFYRSKSDCPPLERLRNAFETMPPEVQVFYDFVAAESKRGLMHPTPRRRPNEE